MKGATKNKVVSPISIGFIILAAPKIKRILVILLQIMFPTLISPNPFLAALKLALSSGREVPMATTVMPMKTVEISNNVAIQIAFVTRYLAPKTIKTCLSDL
jgi:hypothetical protein